MHAVLMEHLYNKEYQQETASEDTKLLVELIKNKIKGKVTFRSYIHFVRFFLLIFIITQLDNQYLSFVNL